MSCSSGRLKSEVEAKRELKRELRRELTRELRRDLHKAVANLISIRGYDFLPLLVYLF